MNTENNQKINKIQVESYEQLEMEPNQDNDAELRRLVEELGLDGQRKLLSAEKKVNPFRTMTMHEYAAYKCFLPRHVRVSDYANPIPIRVLEILALAKSLDFFTSFEIWSNDDDPLLVGVKDHQHYLLARWGESLLSFAEIEATIGKKMREALKACITMTDHMLIEKFWTSHSSLIN